MPFTDEIYEARASQGDVAKVALDVSGTLFAIQAAFEKLGAANGVDLSAEVSEIQNRVTSLHDIFDRLTGWVPERDG